MGDVSSMRVLVTGGAGFIGSHLVRALLSRGHRVTVLDSLLTGKKENLAEVERDLDGFIPEDIRDLSVCRRAVRGREAVFHQAALPSVPRSVSDPILSNGINVTGTLNLLVATRDAGAGRFVFASSSSVYGDTPVLPKREDMPPSPLSPYALQKLAGETYVRLFHDLYRLPTISLRYFNVFGPRQDPASQYAAVIPLFITSVLQGMAPSIFGDGEQTRDFTYVEDTVHANLLALSAPALAGEAVNIATGSRVSLNRLLDLVERETGAAAGRTTSPPRQGDILHSQADISLAGRLLGYRPEVPFEEGIRRTVEHYRSRASSRI